MAYDVAIVGTGPAGVSVAFPLVEAGLRVVMIDAGQEDGAAPPRGDYFSLRVNDPHQWEWMVGRDLYALHNRDATSPKLRVPTLAGTFVGFREMNHIETVGFAALGSLATGGLSNAWGAGVARFDRDELAAFPIGGEDLTPGYEAVSRRIGLSGRSDDDLTEYFGVDDWADPALELDPNCTIIFDRYRRRKKGGWKEDVTMGRSRLAVLVQDREGRLGCNRSGLCLWGCSRQAIYSARHDLEALKRHPNLEHASGIVVRELARSGENWSIRSVDRGGGDHSDCVAKAVVLAAGTIATTAIALRTMGIFDRPLRLLSNPTAAFLAMLPERLGREVTSGQNLAQLSMRLGGLSQFGPVHCTLFSATQIPAYEFVRHLPLSRALAIDAWRLIAPAAIAGNCFLPGEHSAHSLLLRANGKVIVQGGSGAALKPSLEALRRSLGKIFRPLGAMMPPGGFLAGAFGSDIHYAGTLPMVREARPLTTDSDGKLAGLTNVFVADAACLPSLPAKPHTLTMMANAHRIGNNIARRLESG